MFGAVSDLTTALRVEHDRQLVSVRECLRWNQGLATQLLDLRRVRRNVVHLDEELNEWMTFRRANRPYAAVDPAE
jgi:hypothetical protein